MFKLFISSGYLGWRCLRKYKYRKIGKGTNNRTKPRSTRVRAFYRHRKVDWGMEE